MHRRTAVRTVGGITGGAVAALAGCLFDDDADDPEGDPEPEAPDHEGPLRIATYESMVTGTDPAGPWLKETFEAEFPDAEIEWVVPRSGFEHYLRRADGDAEIDVDVCFGVTVGDLARIDDRLGEGALLRELNTDRIDGSERIRDDLEFGDPYGRALAYDTGYVSLVYDERAVDPPDSFADLTAPEYADALAAQHPVTSIPGQTFLLWTIATGDPDGAMRYWEELTTNDARIYDSWTDAYGAYADGEHSLVVSYSTDPVVASASDREPHRHRVAFLDDEGYALPEGMGIFRDAAEPDLAYAFLEFVLAEETQAELARRNVQFPAVDGVALDPGFTEAAREPPESVSLSYTDLRGTVSGWLEGWTDRFDERTVERSPGSDADPDPNSDSASD